MVSTEMEPEEEETAEGPNLGKSRVKVNLPFFLQEQSFWNNPKIFLMIHVYLFKQQENSIRKHTVIYSTRAYCWSGIYNFLT